MTKPTLIFYTTFKNVPYSDEEWERANKWRAKLAQDNPTWAEKHPEDVEPLKTRPVHSFRYGHACFSHEEARKVCEQALESGVQMVTYSAWDSNKQVGEWSRRQGGHWYQSK